MSKWSSAWRSPKWQKKIKSMGDKQFEKDTKAWREENA